MNTSAQPSSPSPKLQLTLNKQTLEIQMELNALLTSFGAPTDLAQVAATEWERDLLIEDDAESKSTLYYLPIRLIPAFIDQILDQLSVESSAEAIQFRDGFRAVGASTNKLITLTQTNRPEVLDLMQQWMKKAPTSYALHELIAAQFKRSTAFAPNPATQGSL
ncbi:MAG: hypothetical protein ACLGID_03080 [Gammaproteobacteria bacterium]|jgi:hypothetical protein|uniref:hypothetical protein n=1 Tax=Pseudomonas peli TaxID=592361 RepID=UPI0028624E18|nr:hypothetical protein [Pseudomonas peli]MDR7025417.1 hypothetical protein [Pseudomonas peli]HZX51456.1 hypothetical protein [Pseudomonas sp.]